MTNKYHFKTRIHIFLVIMNLILSLSSYRKEAEKTVIAKEDHHRAETKIPRHDYKGMDFTDMSRVLNYWINSSYSAIPCDMWKVEELQQLQALLYIAKESQFDDIYHQTSDNRRIRHQILEVRMFRLPKYLFKNIFEIICIFI